MSNTEQNVKDLSEFISKRYSREIEKLSMELFLGTKTKEKIEEDVKKILATDK